MSINIEIVGVIGGFILTSSIIPQIEKCIRTRSTKDLSWNMFALYYMGISINLIYGIMIHHPAIYINCYYSIFANTVLVCIKWSIEHKAERVTSVESAV